VASTTETTVASTTETTKATEGIRIAFVTDGSVADGGWYGAMDKGRVYLEENVPSAEVVSLENVAPGQIVQRTFEDLAIDGYDLIISTSTFDADMAIVAPQFPDTVFLQSCDATMLDNMAQYCLAVEDGRYVDGQLAASLSESGKIGYVIGFALPSVIKPLNTFVLGAQSVDADIEVTVILTNSWFDPSLERQAAESLVTAGADVLTYDLSSSAVPEVAAQNGIPFVGFGYDDAATQAPEAWAGGSLYNWGPSWVVTAEQIMAGTWESTYIYDGFTEDGLRYSDLGDMVSDDTAALLDETIASLRAGTFSPFTGPVEDREGNLIVPAGEVYDPELVPLCCEWVVSGVVGDI